MNRQTKLNNRRRATVLTRKQELKEAREQNNALIANLIGDRLEPFIVAEVARQIKAAMEDLRDDIESGGLKG